MNEVTIKAESVKQQSRVDAWCVGIALNIVLFALLTFPPTALALMVWTLVSPRKD